MYSAPPDLLAVLRGPISKGMEGEWSERGRRREGKGERRGRRKGGKGVEIGLERGARKKCED